MAFLMTLKWEARVNILFLRWFFVPIFFMLGVMTLFALPVFSVRDVWLFWVMYIIILAVSTLIMVCYPLFTTIFSFKKKRLVELLSPCRAWVFIVTRLLINFCISFMTLGCIAWASWLYAPLGLQRLNILHFLREQDDYPESGLLLFIIFILFLLIILLPALNSLNSAMSRTWYRWKRQWLASLIETTLIMFSSFGIFAFSMAIEPIFLLASSHILLFLYFPIFTFISIVAFAVACYLNDNIAEILSGIDIYM